MPAGGYTLGARQAPRRAERILPQRGISRRACAVCLPHMLLVLATSRVQRQGPGEAAQARTRSVLTRLGPRVQVRAVRWLMLPYDLVIEGLGLLGL